MTNIPIYIPEHVSIQAIACSSLLIMAQLIAAPGAYAQNELPGEVIDLPSVSEYRLPPGEETPAGPAAEGPVAENGLPPRANETGVPNTANAPARPSVQVPVQAPVPTAGNNPEVEAPAGQQSPPRPAPGLSQTAPDRQAPSASENRPTFPSSETAPLEINPPSADDIPRADNIQNQTQSTASETDPIAANPVNASAENRFFYIGAGAALVLLLFSIFLYLRRRRMQPAVEEAVPEPAETSAPPISNEPRPLALKIEPRKPAPPSKKSHDENRTGFVTSKLGKRAPNQIDPKTSNIAEKDPGNVKITFVPRGVSSTLLNAVLDYTVQLTNRGDSSIANIRLSGLMMQADKQAASLKNGETAQETAQTASGPVHAIGSLAPGEMIEFSGTIRLPLHAIRPISFQSQALFIPLSRFTAEYDNELGDHVSHSESFIVGEEHQPRRAKLAPFRLDLGPRNFGPLGQRSLHI